MTDAVVLHFEGLTYVLIFMLEFLVLVLSANNTNLGTVPVLHFVLLIFTSLLTIAIHWY